MIDYNEIIMSMTMKTLMMETFSQQHPSALRILQAPSASSWPFLWPAKGLEHSQPHSHCCVQVKIKSIELGLLGILPINPLAGRPRLFCSVPPSCASALACSPNLKFRRAVSAMNSEAGTCNSCAEFRCNLSSWLSISV